MLNASGSIKFNQPISDQTKTSESTSKLPQNSSSDIAISDIEQESNKELAETISDPKIRNVIQKSKPIFRVYTVFPFELFPKEVVIDINKVSVLDDVFFGSGGVISVDISHIANVSVEKGMFFAELTVTDRYARETPIMVDYLPIEKAEEARRIIEGIMIATTRGINLVDLSPDDIRKLAESLGTTYTSLGQDLE